MSNRELQVMQGIWRCDQHRAIAKDLGMSVHTVATHWLRIRRKTGTTCPIEAIHQIYAVLFNLRLKEMRKELRAEFTTENTEGTEGDGVKK